MSSIAFQPQIYVPDGSEKKENVFNNKPNNFVNLNHELISNQPPDHSQKKEIDKDEENVYKIGRYFLLHRLEGDVYKAVNWQTKEECICKIFQIIKYRESLAAYWQVDEHENISSIAEIMLAETKAYVFFERHYGDLHSYVRQRKRLKEEEAIRLFEQIISAVHHCHANGIVLRDLKLRKFVFKNPERTKLKLDGLEDACVLDDEADDRLTDKHGCPAYVGPELLNTNKTYSGKSADIWSLGVMLYTMLVGRYPFHDSDPSALFSKIRRGQFTIPHIVSSKAKCLIKSMLRREPDERLSASEILQHPWINGTPLDGFVMVVDNKNVDQTVPNVVVHGHHEESFF